MKLVILGFAVVGDSTQVAVLPGVHAADARRVFQEMRLAKTPVGGLPVVELWDEDRGYTGNRYFADAKPHEPTTIGKTMKKIKTSLGVLLGLGLLTPALLAQSPSYTAVTLGYSTNVTASGTWTPLTTWPLIDCRKAQNVAIQVSFKLDGAGTGLQTITLARSVDGSNFDTGSATRYAWGITANGTTTVNATTNITVGGAGYLKLVSWGNADAGQNATNTAVKYSLKLNAP